MLLLLLLRKQGGRMCRLLDCGSGCCKAYCTTTHYCMLLLLLPLLLVVLQQGGRMPRQLDCGSGCCKAYCTTDPHCMLPLAAAVAQAGWPHVSPT
jgi:hypothetical protein